MAGVLSPLSLSMYLNFHLRAHCLNMESCVEDSQMDIIVYRHDGSIVLDDGGWGSRTTADRMNRLTPDWLCVRTRKGETQVSDDGGKTYMPLWGETAFVPPLPA